MASPIAKVSIGRSGYGAAHASYITRLSALDPQRREGDIAVGRRADQPSLFSAFRLDMNKRLEIERGYRLEKSC